MSLITVQDLIDNEVPNAVNNTHWQSMITAAENWVKDYCQRDIEYGEYIEKLITDSDGLTWLTETPIDSITTFKISDSEVTESEYEINLTTGKIETWSDVEIEVTYDGGYETIPQAIKTATCMVTNIIHLQFQQGVAQSQSVGGVSVSFQSVEEVYKCAKELLKPYRHRVI